MAETKQPIITPQDADARVRRVELLISNLLRGGVLLSTATIAAGLLFTFLHHRPYFSSRAELRPLLTPGTVFPHTLIDVFRGARHLHGQALVMIGLFLLIATPVLRVAVSIFAFVYQRDRAFVVITSIVLILLIASFVLGKASM